MGRSLFVTLVLLSSFLIVGCDDDTSSNNANNANNANNTSNTTNTNNSNHTNNTNNSNNTNNTQERLTVDVLQEGNEERDGVLFDYQLLRLTWGDRDATYAYIALPSTISSTVGMVLSTMPYDVIDWTGESVDEQAALTGTPTTIETLHENSYVHLLHGFGHLAVFGRFYTEHSIRNDVNDMITGLKYLGQHPRVDANRIGIQGGSWGGFEALYAAAYAPPEAIPAAGVAFFPVSDFAHMVEHVTSIPERVADPTKENEYATFFQPYLERIYLTTGGPAGEAGSDYTGFTHASMLPMLSTPFMVWHETNDTLVPFEQSTLLAQEAPDLIDPLFWYNESPLDLETAPLDHGYFNEAAYSLMFSYLYTTIGNPGQDLYIIHFPEAFHDLMVHIRDLGGRGYDPSFMAAHLAKLMDERILLFVDSETPVETGRAYLTAKINELYCLSPALTEIELDALLQAGTLPEPLCL